MEKKDREDKKLERTNNFPEKEEHKSGFKRIINIIEKMLKKGTKDYTEIEHKKVGNFNIDRGMRIRFLDKDQSDIDWIKKKKWKS